MKHKLPNLTNKIALMFSTFGGYSVQQPAGLRPEVTTLGGIVSRFFAFTLPVVGILGFVFFLWSGFEFLTSRGDPKALAAAKARLTYAVIGLVVVFLAYSVTLYFTSLFGLSVL